mgnify:FL=1|tara:strand:+ start:1161 stop:1403 length:243 start_codon:yes stop_codon:yes gene_type:complete
MGMAAAITKAVKMGAVKKVDKPQPVTPTVSEVSQSSAMNADGYAGGLLRAKRKGRSATILTSSTGVEGDATLGKKSLLGS